MENDGRPSEKVLTSFSGASKKGEEVTITTNITTTTAKRKKQKLGKSNSGTTTGTNEGQGGPTSEGQAFREMIYLDGDGGGLSNSTGASGVSIGDDLLTKTPSSAAGAGDSDAATAQV